MIGSIFIVILNSLICFCFFRLTASYIIQYLMNNNAEKKRKKGQTFKDWLLFKRFRTEIPKYHIIMYYICSMVYVALLFVMIIFHIVNADVDKIFVRKLWAYIFLGNAVLLGVYNVIVFGFHTSYTFITEWIKFIFVELIKKNIEKK